MTAKEYLQQYRAIENRIEDITEQVSRLRSRLTSTTIKPNPDKIQSSPEDPMSATIEQIQKFKNEINALIDQKVNLGHDIIQMISRLDRQQRDVLQMKYMDGCSFEIIAVHMGITYEWSKELHNRGLKEMDKYYLTS